MRLDLNHRCKHCGDLGRKIKYCPICAPIVDKERNCIRAKRFRKRHGNNRVKEWIEKHPEERRLQIRNYTYRHKEQRRIRLLDWRHKNPEKRKQQNKRAKNKIKRRRVCKQWYHDNKEIVVAVTCVFCGEIVLGRAGKYLCHSCLAKWQRHVPQHIAEELSTCSTVNLSKDQLIWKRIIDVRKHGFYTLAMVIDKTKN